MARDTGLLTAAVMKVVQRWAPWISIAVLVAGVVAYAVTRLSDSAPAAAPLHRVARLGTAERRVAREFLHTAVARKHLDRAWAIAAPELRQDMTLAEWKTGTIPVVPYPVDEAFAQLKVLSSFTDAAEIQVRFLPHTGAKTKPASFRLGLRKLDGAWVVSSWLPSAAIVPPSGK
jgi:hypothetical protein